MNYDKTKNIILTNDVFNNILKTVSYFYVTLMVSIFPLFCTNWYFNIQEDKFNFFQRISFIYFIIAIGLILAKTVTYHSFNLKQFWEKLLHSLSVTDIGITIFTLCCILSTIFSKYPKESFYGNLGRQMGLEMYLILYMIYILISRYFKFHINIIVLWLIISDFMAFIGIMQRLHIDMFRFYDHLSKDQINFFLSTIGHIDFYSSYLVMVFAASICLYILCKDTFSKWIYGFSALVNFLMLVLTNCDSGILASAVILFMLTIYSMRDIGLFNRVLFFLLLGGGLIKLFGLISNHFQPVPEYSIIQKTLIQSNEIYIFLGFIAIVLFIFRFLEGKNFDFKKSLTFFRKMIIFCASISILLVLSLLLYFSVFNKTTNLHSAGQYFRFNKEWGNLRGGLYIAAFDCFKHYNSFQKFFGYGMDLFRPSCNELLMGREVVDNTTTCELLTYLLSVGIIGLGSYLIFVISHITRVLKVYKKEPVLVALTIAVVAYFVQALTNIAVPMVNPLFFLIIAMAESIIRESKMLEVNTGR